MANGTANRTVRIDVRTHNNETVEIMIAGWAVRCDVACKVVEQVGPSGWPYVEVTGPSQNVALLLLEEEYGVGQYVEVTA